MTEYQEFVAGKALVLLSRLEDAALTDAGIAKLLRAMRLDIDLIIQGEAQLPSEILDGWAYYFSPDGPHSIYKNYPELVQADADLAFALRRSDMAAYLRSRQLLGRK